MGKAFGTAGVRGVFNETQTPAQVYGLAETVAFVFGRGRYGVGWDGRKVSALLARTVVSAVSSVGSDAVLFGMVPTPVVAYGTRARSCAAGFSVTASHNPPQFSGVKAFNAKGMELSRSEEERVERAAAVDVRRSSGTFGVAVDDMEIVEEYIAALASRHQAASRPLRIAVDCANGPGGLVTPRVLAMLGHRVIPVNSQASWRFPARLPEPTRGNLTDFTKAVSSMGVDLGFAHDGDADRLVILNKRGEVLPDSVVSILALRSLGGSGGTVAISENSSTAVEEEAVGLGFKVARSRVGKTFAVLEEENGVFATEPSKVVDPKWGLWEDGINAAAAISTLVSKENSVLEDLMEKMNWHYQQVNLDVAVRMSKLVGNAKSSFKKFRIVEERTLDGLKLVLGDGSWVMFRPSGTEPKTRLYCESRDSQLLETLVQQGKQCIESSL